MLPLVIKQRPFLKSEGVFLFFTVPYAAVLPRFMVSALHGSVSKYILADCVVDIKCRRSTEVDSIYSAEFSVVNMDLMSLSKAMPQSRLKVRGGYEVRDFLQLGE